MHDQVLNGIQAIILGGLVCVLLFVPFVAVSYRRRGKLTLGRTALWVSAVVYAIAIWTYTLLPLPEEGSYTCAPINLNPWDFVHELELAQASGNPLTSPHLLQLVFNVILFIPLGFFVRVLGGRGVIVATLVGLGVSLLVETTQITGVWGLYDCAYRVGDVVDLMTNTAGAIIGALLAYVIPGRLRGAKELPDADLPRPVTRSRRMLAMLCDLLGFFLVVISVTTVIALAGTLLFKDTGFGDWPNVIGLVTAMLTWTIVISVSGQSIGDKAVQLRYVSTTMPEWWVRMSRVLGGIVGWHLVGAVPVSGPLISLGFAIVAVILVFTTPAGRGLPGAIGSADLSDARDQSYVESGSNTSR